jgi:hypothetical protein
MIVIIFRSDIFCFNFSRNNWNLQCLAKSQHDFLPWSHKLISFWWRLFYRCNCSTHRGHESNNDNMYKTNFILGNDSNRQNWFSNKRGRKLLLGPGMSFGMKKQKKRQPPQQRNNTENLKQIFPDKELRGLSPKIPHSCVCERFKYSHDRSAYSAVGKYVCWPILGIYKSLTDT